MIYYYSGTGNSAYVARKLAGKLGVDTVDIGERIKTGAMDAIHDEVVILVTPTYCWRVPRIVEDYWKQIEVEAETLYLVMTCGSGIGGAPVYEERMAREKNLAYGGAFEVIMPENYIAMFDAPKKEEARAIIAKADTKIDQIAETIAAKKSGAKTAGLLGRLLTFINGAYYALFVKAKPFYAKDNCIGCGECERRCILANVKLEAGRPVWYDRCTHCMACMNYCPVEAIEYGKKSEDKFRYTLEKVVDNDVSSREARKPEHEPR